MCHVNRLSPKAPPHGNLFWRIGGFESNLPIFHLPKLQCDQMSSLLQNHSLCTRLAAKCASLIDGMEFTFEAAYDDIAFPKSFDQGGELACLSTRGRRSK